MYGPETEFSQILHSTKYREPNESFDDYCVRYARATSDGDDHFRRLLDGLRHQRILPGGRQQRAVGQPFQTTAINCFISSKIEDSMEGIMKALTEAALTSRTGGGIGQDFSTLRPANDPVRGLGAGAISSGPISFMRLWDAMGKTVESGGSRRAALMGCLRVDHPDILNFIHCKRNQNELTGFNISVTVTNKFMEALYADGLYSLSFNGRKYRDARAVDVWATIMENTWDWAEPGVLFIDRINEWDNLWYLNDLITCTNPCLPEGTLINTPSGLIPVEKIQEGDLIDTVDVPHTVTSIEKHESVEVFKVSLSNGMEIEATGAHIFHTREPGIKRAWNSEKRLDQLREGDLVRIHPVSCPDGSSGVDYPNLSRFEAGLLVGTILGDGCLKAERTFNICFNKKESKWATVIHNLAIRLGASGNILDSGTTHNINLTPAFSRWVMDNFDIDGDKNPNLVKIANQGKDFICGVIDGLISTDGTVSLSANFPQIRITGKKEICRLVQQIALMLGSHGRFYLKAKKGDSSYIDNRKVTRTRDCFDIAFGGRNIKTLWDAGIKISHPEKHERLKQQIYYWRLEGETWAASIVSIEPVGKKRVFDLYEKETDTWISGGIVSRGCGEAAMSPYDSCLLGSLNLVKYLVETANGFDFNTELFVQDTKDTIRAFDKVIDISNYPLQKQKDAGRSKRRVGLGITAMANTLEAIGYKYGSRDYLRWQGEILATLRDAAYEESIQLAVERGPFPLFDKEKFPRGKFIATLPEHIQHGIKTHGIRHSELLKIAPTGTISLAADNVSSGVEPTFEKVTHRTVIMPGGPQVVTVRDYIFEKYEINPTTHSQVKPEQHIEVLCNAQKYVDNAISKTCNVKGEVHGQKVDGDEISFSDFKNLYLQAWEGGAKGCTTFNSNGKRFGLLRKEKEGGACFFDPETGTKTCDE